MTGIQQGVLVLADITGYSRFLSAVELDHSQDVLADLLGAVVAPAEGVLQLAKLEGDAVFWFGPADVTGSALLSVLDAAYFAFRRRRRDIEHLTTCKCDACRRIPDLDLKFVVHAGDFAIHSVAGLTELVGANVVTVHRLLKNSVADQTGASAYAAFSAPAAELLELVGDAFLPCSEHYDDIGAVELVALDLDRRWTAADAAASTAVDDETADFVVARDLPAPPATVWTWLVSPELRMQWNGADAIDQHDPDGVPGIGSVSHCVHGKLKLTEHIVGWHPVAEVTLRSRVPVGSFLITFTLTASGEDRCELIGRMRAEGNAVRRAALRLVAKRMRAESERSFERLEALVAGRAAPPR